MSEISIYIIDDHKLFVEGLCSLLAEVEGFKIAGYSLNPLEFINLDEKPKANVYLMDINMPQISGVELTIRLKKINPEAKILDLTMFDEYEYVEQMIVAGASGYILKSESLQELIRAIKIVAEGLKYFGTEIQEMLFNKVEKNSAGKNIKPWINDNKHFATLTKREIEILILISKEFSTRQIAEKLYISERTVETHRKNIFSKTKAKTAIGLSKYAEKHGYITKS